MGKRAFDASVAAVLLIVGAPLLFLLGLAVWLSVGWPVFFVQERIGRYARPFRAVKFRTMRDAVDPAGRPLSDERRLTRLGRLLRSSSLDELPELWNVVCGEMSLVGPRPLLPAYLPRYTPRQARRHEVRPGITGWTQVTGRNSLSWSDKLERDVWYVEHQSFLLDLKILIMTIGVVLRASDISAPDHATMPEFMGAPDPNEVDRPSTLVKH